MAALILTGGVVSNSISNITAAKRVVVRVVQAISRERAVELLWWEPSDDVLTLYFEGRLATGGTTRTSYTFDRDLLSQFAEPGALTELRRRMTRVVAPFAPRSSMGLNGGRRLRT